MWLSEERTFQIRKPSGWIPLFEEQQEKKASSVTRVH